MPHTDKVLKWDLLWTYVYQQRCKTKNLQDKDKKKGNKWPFNIYFEGILQSFLTKQGLKTSSLQNKNSRQYSTNVKINHFELGVIYTLIAKIYV